MEKTLITINSKQTQKLGELLARELRGGEVICLDGELGAGKTTFTQGLLKGLKIKGPYTSPTFLIIKHYKKEFPISNFQFPNKLQKSKSQIQNVYHIDAYRVEAQDILNLGWEEILSDRKNIIIIEWASRIEKIIPNPPAGGVLQINFEWLDENKRKIIFK